MTVIEQLEREQYEESQGDAVERAWRIGHNTLVRAAIAIVKLDAPELMERLLVFVSEQAGDDTARAFNRGRNSGVRHVRDALQREIERRERDACEARGAFAKASPVEFGLQELVGNTPAEPRE